LRSTWFAVERWNRSWAPSLIAARPLKEGDSKHPDRRVDGLLYFYEAKEEPLSLWA